jgi:hypothetical protein
VKKKTPKYGNPQKHLRLSDLRGLAQLSTDATAGVTEIVEGVHHSVLKTMGLNSAEAPRAVPGIAGLVYKSIYTVNQMLAKGLEVSLGGLENLLGSGDEAPLETPQRDIVLAALNGVMGDRLVASNSPFAIPMSLRHKNEVMNWESISAVPEASAKILLLIHGLCMNDLHRYALYGEQMPDHGTALASKLGYTPFYLHYNSGLHTSQNGRKLATQLEQLLTNWPVPVEEICIVAHSMGGLVSRSACHYARQDNMQWPTHLKDMVFLGTPHHGAPLEKAGNWLDLLLGSTPYSRPFASLGQLRSSGITDLRYGHVVEEDWMGHDRFKYRPDQRHGVPLPEGVACHTVAACMAGKRSTLADRLVGDGLVPLHSALGQHKDEGQSLKFANDSQWVAHRTNHMELLTNPEVRRQIEAWLTVRGLQPTDFSQRGKSNEQTNAI